MQMVQSISEQEREQPGELPSERDSDEVALSQHSCTHHRAVLCLQEPEC